jgi:hypothetical protein
LKNPTENPEYPSFSTHPIALKTAHAGQAHFEPSDCGFAGIASIVAPAALGAWDRLRFTQARFFKKLAAS